MRISPSFQFEDAAGRSAGALICGADEAGRGPLAGPVVAAALIWHPDAPAELLAEIGDSKQLSEAKRLRLFPLIKAHSYYAIAEASVAEIDNINILHASLLAMRRAITALSPAPAHALIDGNKLPKELPCPATAVVKGDAYSLSIAGASILAKVARDHVMQELARQYPHYGWAENAAYPTAQHLAAIKEHGITPHHRQSFGPVAAVIRERAA